MNIKMSLAKKIIIGCILLVVIPAVVLGIRFYKHSSDILKTQLNDHNITLVNSFNDYYLSYFNENLKFFVSLWADEENIALINTNESIKKYYSNEWEKALLGYPEIRNVFYGDEQGRLFLLPEIEIPKDYDPRTKDWYKESLINPDTIIFTEAYRSVTGNLVFSVQKLLKDEIGNPIGVFGIDVNLEEVEAELMKSKLSQKGCMLIINEKGKILAKSKNNFFEDSLVEDIDFFDKFDLDNGSFNYEIDGKNVIVSYVTNIHTNWKVVGIISEEELYAQIRPLNDFFYRVLLYVGIWAILIVVGFTYGSRKIVVEPIQKLMRVMKRVENGDMTFEGFSEYKSNDEIGELFVSYSNMLSAQRDLLVRMLITATKISASAQKTSEISKMAAEASHTQDFSMADLSMSMDEMSKSIQEVMNSVTCISNGIGNIDFSMKEIGGTSSDMAQSAVDTASAISEVLYELKSLEKLVNEINENLEIANRQGQEVVDMVSNGKVVVSDTKREMEEIHCGMESLVNVIEELGKSAEQISEIIEVIEDLTEQTNLLSLNASIEAARAGEHGKGFAVVASSIGKLSEKSRDATKNVEKLVRKIQSSVLETVENTNRNVEQIDRGVELVNSTENAFSGIESSVKETMSKFVHIAKATNLQVNSNRSILNSTSKVSDLTTQISAASEMQLAMIEELVTVTEQLNIQTHEVADNGTILASNSEQVASTSQCLKEMTTDMSRMSVDGENISAELNEQAKILVDLVNKFKL